MNIRIGDIINYRPSGMNDTCVGKVTAISDNILAVEWNGVVSIVYTDLPDDSHLNRFESICDTSPSKQMEYAVRLDVYHLLNAIAKATLPTFSLTPDQKLEMQFLINHAKVIGNMVASFHQLDETQLRILVDYFIAANYNVRDLQTLGIPKQLAIWAFEQGCNLGFSQNTNAKFEDCLSVLLSKNSKLSAKLPELTNLNR